MKSKQHKYDPDGQYQHKWSKWIPNIPYKSCLREVRGEDNRLLWNIDSIIYAPKYLFD